MGGRTSGKVLRSVDRRGAGGSAKTAASSTPAAVSTLAVASMPGAAAWVARVRSPGFRRSLLRVVREEIAAAGSAPMRDLIDAGQVRAAIAAWDPASVRAAAAARVAVKVNERLEKRLGRAQRSLEEMMGPSVMEGVNALLDEDLPNPQALEQILAQTIRQKFVRKLFAELIHSAILAFNKRVNPIFSGITASMLDDQIRGFISLGMPMLQEQAVAFALSRANQDFVVDLARGLIRSVLAEPLGDLVPRSSAGQRARIESLIVRVVESDRFREQAPVLALRVFDDVYAQLRDEKLAVLIDVDSLAEVLAEPLAELAIAVLTRPRVAELLAGR